MDAGRTGGLKIIFMEFNRFWNKAPIAPEYRNRYYATRDLWDTRTPAAQNAMYEDAAQLAGKNPYFFVQDYPEPQPVFLRGDESGDIVQVRYNGAYKLCHRATMELFGLEWVRDW